MYGSRPRVPADPETPSGRLGVLHTERVLRLQIVLGLVTLALCIYSLIDVIRRDGDAIKHLPKVGWIVLVLLFPFVGSVAWLLAGRGPLQRTVQRYERAVPEFPEYDRPGRAAAADPEADAEFLRRVRERAEQQRGAYREAREKELREGNQGRPATEPEAEPEGQGG
jgi:hypothetical protein